MASKSAAEQKLIKACRAALNTTKNEKRQVDKNYASLEVEKF